MTYNEGYDDGYRAGMQKMREVGGQRIEEQRKWVGLTKEDRDSVLAGSWFVLDDQAMNKVEAILKEKNTP